MNIVGLFIMLLASPTCAQNRPKIVKISNNPIFNISINPERSDKTIEGSKLFDSVEYIKLETLKSCLIGNVQKVIMADEKYFVLSFSTAQVYCFNYEGKYLFTLNKKGLGPKETGEISDIAYDKFNNLLILSDRQKHNIYFYSLNGDYIEKISFKYWVYDLMPISKDEVVLRTTESNGLDLKLYSTVSKNVTYEAIKLQSLDDICQGYDYFSEYGDKILFTPVISDTIYEVKSNGVECRYTVDFGKYSIPRKLKATPNHRIVFSYYKLNKYNYAGIIGFAWESNSYIGFNYGYNGQANRVQVLVNKKNNSIKQFQAVNIEGYELTINKLFHSSQNTNYGIIDPVTVVKEAPKSVKPFGRYSKLTDVINISSDSDNPIIAIYKLKPNL